MKSKYIDEKDFVATVLSSGRDHNSRLCLFVLRAPIAFTQSDRNNNKIIGDLQGKTRTFISDKCAATRGDNDKTSTHAHNYRRFLVSALYVLYYSLCT